MIEGISEDMLRRYVKMREKVSVEANAIQSLSNLLGLFQQFGDDTIEVDPFSLGYSQSLIERSILNILEFLDDFIYIIEAQNVIETPEKK